MGAEDDECLPVVCFLKQLAHSVKVCVGPYADTAKLEDMPVGIYQTRSWNHLTSLPCDDSPNDSCVASMRRNNQFQDLGRVKSLFVKSCITQVDVILNL